MGQDSNWGGRRANAGRKPKEIKHHCNEKRVARIKIWDLHRIDGGIYDEILERLQTIRREMDVNNASRSSPRWTKMWALMDGLDNLLGSDYETWTRPTED